MKYKVGDKVFIKKDLIIGKEYGGTDGACIFASGMEIYRAKMVTITCILAFSYQIEEDANDNYGHWNWTDEMIEGFYDDKVEDEKEIKPDKKEAIVTTFTYLEGIQYFTELNSATGKIALNSHDILERTEKIIQSGNITIVILDDGSKGKSKCDPDDKYDEEEGIKIARARAKMKSVKKELKQLLQ